MRTIRSLLFNHRIAVLVVVLLSLAVRAFLPTGHMVGAHSQNITVYLCAEAGGSGQMITIPIERQAPDSGDHDGQKQTGCGFAAMASVGALPTATGVALIRPDDDPAPVRAMAIAPGRGLAAPPPFATGPPVHF